MRNTYKLSAAFFAVIVFSAASLVFAAEQSSEVAAGQTLWSQLQAKQVQCSQLTDVNYENLGEYFMQQMMGTNHEATNQMIEYRYGQSGLDQMHIAMGKRLSNCDPNAAYPFVGMMGYGSPMMGAYYNNGNWPISYQGSPMFNMMGWGYGRGWSGGWLSMILFWILVIIGLVSFLQWIRHGGGRHRKGSAMEILKERYAKGEINRSEFGEKKKDLE